jgi:hypothetical protein
MTFKNWFAKEIYIRLAEEGDCFVSTVSYSIAPPKTWGLRFKRTALFRTDGGVVGTPLVLIRSGRKNCTKILEL